MQPEHTVLTYLFAMLQGAAGRGEGGGRAVSGGPAAGATVHTPPSVPSQVSLVAAVDVASFLSFACSSEYVQQRSHVLAHASNLTLLPWTLTLTKPALLLASTLLIDRQTPASLHLNGGPATVSSASLICTQQRVKGSARNDNLSRTPLQLTTESRLFERSRTSRLIAPAGRTLQVQMKLLGLWQTCCSS